MPEQSLTPEQTATALWKEVRSMTPSQVIHAMVDAQIAIRKEAVIGQAIDNTTKEYWKEVKKFV